MGQDFTSFTVPIFPFISDVFKSANITEHLPCTRFKRSPRATWMNKTREGPHLHEVKSNGIYGRKLLSHAQFFVSPWNIQSMEFSRSEYWSG